MTCDGLRPATSTPTPSIKRSRLIEQEGCTHTSLDHDLGRYNEDGGEGYILVLWMAEQDRWPSHGIRVHSANVVGLRRILAVIDRYGPYPNGYNRERGDWAIS